MTGLKEGMKAPSFTGIDQDGNRVSLEDYKGSRLALYFYPHDNTPTCTDQACNLRDNYEALLKKGYKIVGVSTDDVRSHAKFIKKFSLPFPLIADEDRKIVNRYKVWGEKKFMGRTFDGTHRTTFLVDEAGKIRKIIDKPKSRDHAREILEAWQ